MCKCKTGCVSGHCTCEREGSGCTAACGCTGCENPHGAHVAKHKAVAHDDGIDGLTAALHHAALGEKHAEAAHHDKVVTIAKRGHKLKLDELKAIEGVFYVGSTMRDEEGS